MEIMITPERYKVMKYVSQQKQAFRLAEMYYLMKRIDSEKINRASEHLSNNCPFMLAETDFAIPITPEQKSNIKKKIEQLKR